MIVFFFGHPGIGWTVNCKNILTGETAVRTVQQRLKRVRRSNIDNSRQRYFEVVMIDNDTGEIVTAEYEVEKDLTI